MRDELRDRFGPLPEPAVNVLRLVELKVRSLAAGVDKVDVERGGRLQVSFSSDRVPDRKGLAAIADRFAGRLTFHTADGISMTVRSAAAPAARPARPGAALGSERPRPAGPEEGAATIEARVADLENLLYLLEISDK
jgi:hypothetical protein